MKKYFLIAIGYTLVLTIIIWLVIPEINLFGRKNNLGNYFFFAGVFIIPLISAIIFAIIKRANDKATALFFLLVFFGFAGQILPSAVVRLKYYVLLNTQGKETKGVVDNAFLEWSSSSSKSSSRKLELWYTAQFIDNGKAYHSQIVLDKEGLTKKSDTVTVLYLPNKPEFCYIQAN